MEDEKTIHVTENSVFKVEINGKEYELNGKMDVDFQAGEILCSFECKIDDEELLAFLKGESEIDGSDSTS